VLEFESRPGHQSDLADLRYLKHRPVLMTIASCTGQCLILSIDSCDADAFDDVALAPESLRAPLTNVSLGWGRQLRANAKLARDNSRQDAHYYRMWIEYAL
jgi:hypothetical protein